MPLVDCPMLVNPGNPAGLHDRNTNSTGDFKDKDDASDATRDNLDRLDEQQEMLYAQAKHSLLIVLQGMDTAGKDGTIESVMGAVNPQGVEVTSFKRPSELELSHDYLWRVHQRVPPKGMIGIFNRSHYEDVAVVRVMGLVTPEVWTRRFRHIVEFERMLAEEGTTIVKIFLHISKDEQKERLQSRLDDKQKNWKFNPGDLDARRRWDEYMHAYEEALTLTSTAHAPWYVVPADRKWYRNFVVSDILTRTLARLDLRYPPPVAGLDQIRVD